VTLPADLEQVALKLAESGALLRSAIVAHTQATGAFERVVKGAVTDGLTALKPAAYPVTDHRRHHRPGRPAKIDSDPSCKRSSRPGSIG